jgi:hypothetical protein
MITVEHLAAFGWPNCCRLSNSLVDLVVTADVGPRVMRFGFIDGANHFAVNAALQGQTGGETWRAYGGHRLWHAPEAVPRTYAPDNGPVAVEQRDGFARFIQPAEPDTGIQKELDIALAPGAASAQVTHRLRNCSPWPVELAPWALSVMAAGGTAVIPLPPRAPHSPTTLLPTSALTLWSYTDLADPRWTLGTRYVLLRQDQARSAYQKIGARVSDGWLAYVRAGEAFVKTFAFDAAARYPDLNTPVEVFTDGDILELETLGPLTVLAPGASVDYAEAWHLLREVPTPHGDDDVQAHLAPRIDASL